MPSTMLPVELHTREPLYVVLAFTRLDVLTLNSWDASRVILDWPSAGIRGHRSDETLNVSHRR